MMNMFALGLEDTLAVREHLLLERRLARLGYADDLHSYGPVKGILQSWNMLVQSLATAGLEVKPVAVERHTGCPGRGGRSAFTDELETSSAGTV